MYAFAGMLVAANVFTFWQEVDARDASEQRRADFEANKLAWEERERRETEQLRQQQQHQQREERQKEEQQTA